VHWNCEVSAVKSLVDDKKSFFLEPEHKGYAVQGLKEMFEYMALIKSAGAYEKGVRSTLDSFQYIT